MDLSLEARFILHGANRMDLEEEHVLGFSVFRDLNWCKQGSCDFGFCDTSKSFPLLSMLEQISFVS